MKRRCLAWLILIVLLMQAALVCAEEESVSLSKKLWLQLVAGSGFSADVTVDVADQNGVSVFTKPVEAKLNYIYVRPSEDSGDTGRHCLDVSLPDGEQTLLSVKAELTGNRLTLQSDAFSQSITVLLSEIGLAAQSITGDTSAENSWFDQTGVPGLCGLLLQVLPSVKKTDETEESLDTLTTQLDVWLEGFRKSVALGKTESGETTLITDYVVSPAELKAELEQLLLNIFSNSTVFSALTDMVGEDNAQFYLNQDNLKQYLSAIDALSLNGDATIKRTVLLSGGTIDLTVSLPLYDSRAGSVNITYARQSGREDLPDETAVTLQSGLRSILITFQQYESMTGVQVLQGEVHSDPADQQAYEVDGKKSSFSFGFSLSCSQKNDTDDQGRNVTSYSFRLAVNPLSSGSDEFAVPNMEADLTATFASNTSTKASTELNANFIIGGEDLPHQVTVTLSGKSKKKWETTQPENATSYSELSAADCTGIFSAVTERISRFMQLYLLPESSNQEN